MYFFFHLVAGIVLGLLIGDILCDRRWVIPCAIGAVLPDLIDKPLGYLVFPTIGDGRFFLHNIFVFIILLAAGLIIWKYCRNPIVLALSLGVLSHQVLDSMWAEPENWLYPALGPLPAHAQIPQEFLVYLLETDLNNPAEWALIAVCIGGAVLYWQREALAAAAVRHARVTRILLACAAAAFLVMCAGVGFCWLWRIPLKDLAVIYADQYAMLMAILVLAAVLLVRWEVRLSHPAAPGKDPGGCSIPGPASREIARMECIVRSLGNDPARISFTSAQETAAAYGILSASRNQKSVLFWTLMLSGTAAVAAGAGALLLFTGGLKVSEGMLALGLMSAGLFFGCILALWGTSPKES